MDSLLKVFGYFYVALFNSSPHMAYKWLLYIEVPTLPLLYVLAVRLHTCVHTPAHLYFSPVS